MGKRTIGVKQDLSRLPGWARKRIERLQAEVESWKAQALAATTSGESNVMLHEPDGDRGLPPSSTIRFAVPMYYKGKRIRDGYVEVRHHRAGTTEWVEIRAYEGGLLIKPEVSNVVLVKCVMGAV